MFFFCLTDNYNRIPCITVTRLMYFLLKSGHSLRRYDKTKYTHVFFLISRARQVAWKRTVRLSVTSSYHFIGLEYWIQHLRLRGSTDGQVLQYNTHPSHTTLRLAFWCWFNFISSDFLLQTRIYDSRLCIYVLRIFWSCVQVMTGYIQTYEIDMNVTNVRSFAHVTFRHALPSITPASASTVSTTSPVLLDGEVLWKLKLSWKSWFLLEILLYVRSKRPAFGYSYSKGMTYGIISES